jgi:hypothetical protein
MSGGGSVPLGNIHGSGGGRERPPGVDSDIGGQGRSETTPPPDQPHLKFRITGVRAVEHAAAPTLSFTMEIEDTSGREVFMSGLTVGIHIEPAKRAYQEQDKAKLVELFGEVHRWKTTAQRMVWSIETVLLPSFTGKTRVEVRVACNYDLELSAAKYFYSVSDGEIPLAFHFNGSIYYAADAGRLQVVQIPWDSICDFKMPIEVWSEMIDSYYPYRGWVPVHRDTLDALQRLKANRGSPTFDAAISELLANKMDTELTTATPGPSAAAHEARRAPARGHKMDLPEGMPQPGIAPPMGVSTRKPIDPPPKKPAPAKPANGSTASNGPKKPSPPAPEKPAADEGTDG